MGVCAKGITKGFKNDRSVICQAIHKELRTFIFDNIKAEHDGPMTPAILFRNEKWHISNQFLANPDMRSFYLNFTYEGENRSLQIAFNLPDGPEVYSPYKGTEERDVICWSVGAQGSSNEIIDLVNEAVSEVVENQVYGTYQDSSDDWYKVS